MGGGWEGKGREGSRGWEEDGRGREGRGAGDGRRMGGEGKGGEQWDGREIHTYMQQCKQNGLHTLTHLHYMVGCYGVLVHTNVHIPKAGSTVSR